MNADQLPLFEDAPTDDVTLRCSNNEPWMGPHPKCAAEADRIIAQGYPQVAGSKATETSRAAAQETDANGLRLLVIMVLFGNGPQTADEAAEGLRMDRLAIRPRFSELKRLGRIEDSGQRRRNASGKMAIVWRLVR